MKQNLTDKVVIVTGATSGIGRATSIALAAAGAKVIVAGRRQERLDEVVKRVQQDGGDAHATVADIADENEARQMVQTARDTYGRVDILVNNAGVMLLGPVLDADTEDWRRMLHTNVLGLMYATHSVLPLMIEQKGGHIVQVSSVAGRTANAGSAVYNASKWAVNAFTEALRQEVYEHNIRTTLIEPGIVETELREHITNEEARKATDEWAASLRQLQAEDIAAGIVYAVAQPDHVNVNEILIRPTDQQR